ncbi:MAG: hypothetical protein HDQ90_02085 [Desulfovibrio sp.]|nr:hypothetical protein [Desulfovibrio sp.]
MCGNLSTKKLHVSDNRAGTSYHRTPLEATQPSRQRQFFSLTFKEKYLMGWGKEGAVLPFFDAHAQQSTSVLFIGKC